MKERNVVCKRGCCSEVVGGVLGFDGRCGAGKKILLAQISTEACDGTPGSVEDDVLVEGKLPAVVVGLEFAVVVAELANG